MNSDLVDILVGLSVNICRSDGRVHPAKVKSVDTVKSTVHVEWTEKSICRGKEVDVDELCAMNKELLEYMVGAAAPSPKVPVLEKKYEGRLRSSRIPAPSTFPKKSMARQTLFQTPAPPGPLPVIKAEPMLVDRPSTSFVKRSAVSTQRKKNEPKESCAMPHIGEDHKENEVAKNAQPLTTARRKSVMPHELHKDNKRSSYALKPFDMQSKKGKFGDAGRPNKQFYQMIEEFRETLHKVPMSLTDQVEAQRICVCVRKRPLNKQEVIKKEIDVISIPGNGSLLVHEPKTKVDLTKYLENQVFHFDHSFDETTTNELVYRCTAKPLLHTIFEGGMATCFAYGQTGSGKTHTMGGDFAGKSQNSANGIYAFAAEDVFTLLNQRRYSGMDLCPYVTFFEIYNGKVFDLLNKKSKLRVMEDENQQVQVVGLEEMRVSCVDDVIRMIKIGSACRTSGQTSANANSSRSHAILQVVLRRRDKLHGKFSLVDLAGNERGTDVSSNHRQTLVETAEINCSLLALKECIRSLGHNSDHIPFRMSKLTQVLRDSFIMENSKTCMIAMIAPGMASCDYTLNTLRYADRVKELNGSSKPSKGERPELQAEYANSSQKDSSSSSEEDSIVPSVFDAISKVAELEERVHEELQMASEVLKPMEQVSYDIEAGAPELEDYARKLLDSVLALRAAIEEERTARMSPKPGNRRV